MKIELMASSYDTRLEASDWRFSAAIVGLVEYFDYWNNNGYEMEYQILNDAVEYCQKDINKSLYLKFCEYYFKKDMNHLQIEELCQRDELSEPQVKLFKELIAGKTILKKKLKDKSFENKEEVLEIIEENREEIVENIFRNGKKLYSNFCNEGSLLKESHKTCRIKGYYVDGGRKTKSLSYSYDYSTFVYEDYIEFDFIPFAFAMPHLETCFFVNNNYSIQALINTARKFKSEVTELESSEEKKISAREIIFGNMGQSASFINYNVEVIKKERSLDFFESLYIKKDAIKIFGSIEHYNELKRFIKITDNYYINLQREITDRIINKLVIDDLIELMMKQSGAKYYYQQFIDINMKIYRCLYEYRGTEKEMNDQMTVAKKTAGRIVIELKKAGKSNKIKSYREKLISAMTMKDYDQFNKILIQLSSYTQVQVSFAYDLFEDFEKNKNLAYTFITAFYEYDDKKNGGNNNEK